MLEEEEKCINSSPRVIIFLNDMIPRIRTIETEHFADVSKAHKEWATEERERIVATLMELFKEWRNDPERTTRMQSILKIAIERISNNQ